MKSLLAVTAVRLQTPVVPHRRHQVDGVRRVSTDRPEAYDKAIDGAPMFIDPPELNVVRMVEQGDVIMAELTGTAMRAAGGEMRMSMAEVFVMRDGKIAERRAWVIPLEENEYR
jgi:ketosteroid isomerase-like protein